MSAARDDLGHPVPLTCPGRRVVSLVPSLDLSGGRDPPGALVGATDWCTHPADLDVPRVRGTKNPNLAAIRGSAARRRAGQPGGEPAGRRGTPPRRRGAGMGDRDPDLDQAVASLRRMFDRAGLAGAGVARRRRTGMEPARARPAGPSRHPHLARPVDGGRIGHVHWRRRRPARPGRRLPRRPRPLPAHRPGPNLPAREP